MVRTLADLAPVLDAAAPWVVLKGPVLYAQQIGDLGPRPSSDLDVLVDPAGLGDAVTALEDIGWRVRERNWDLLARLPFGALHLSGPERRMGGTWPRMLARTPELDLHWDVIHRPAIRRALPIPVGPILSRRRTADVGGVIVPVPDPIDVAVHVAVHAVLGGGATLGWWVDLHRALEVATAAAATARVESTLRERADELGAALPVAVGIDRVHDLFGSGSSEEAFLGDWTGPTHGSAWRRSARALARRPAVGRSVVGRPSRLAGEVVRAVISATRATTRGGAVALLQWSTSLPWRVLIAAIKRTPLRRLLPLGAHVPRLFPGRALTLPSGHREHFLVSIR